MIYKNLFPQSLLEKEILNLEKEGDLYPMSQYTSGQNLFWSRVESEKPSKLKPWKEIVESHLDTYARRLQERVCLIVLSHRDASQMAILWCLQKAIMRRFKGNLCAPLCNQFPTIACCIYAFFILHVSQCARLSLLLAQWTRIFHNVACLIWFVKKS